MAEKLYFVPPPEGLVAWVHAYLLPIVSRHMSDAEYRSAVEALFE